MSLLLLLGWAALAQAQEPEPTEALDEEGLTAHTGQLVAFVTIAAPRGGIGKEPLDPLLRVRQDGIFHPGDVRQDIATLFRAGQFAQVEAWLYPWPVQLPTGEEAEGVRLEYRVYPQPRVARVVVTERARSPFRSSSGTCGSPRATCGRGTTSTAGSPP